VNCITPLALAITLGRLAVARALLEVAEAASDQIRCITALDSTTCCVHFVSLTSRHPSWSNLLMCIVARRCTRSFGSHRGNGLSSTSARCSAPAETELMHAARNGSTPLIPLLLKAGQAGAYNNDGDTALSLAIRSGNSKAAELLTCEHYCRVQSRLPCDLAAECCLPQLAQTLSDLDAARDGRPRTHTAMTTGKKDGW
jgi:ankyrin repeat protein